MYNAEAYSAGRRPKIEDIADALHISSRTFCSGVCKTKDPASRSVLEGARRQLARRYVNNSALELNETAYLLG
jgi:AraC-like DNA-binding protein